ncbi:MAG: 3-dehydroquinate synthase [Chitinophagales bacterium]|nr:3-dehydroquinate synthase [Chitinophagales bacterium]
MSAKKHQLTPGIFYKNFGRSFTDFLAGKKYSAHFILVDDQTVNYCLPYLLREVELLKAAKVIEIFSGEAFKNIDTAQQIWEQLTDAHADRHAVLINLGGGMVCDTGGFAAATFKRGIDFIHVPTTLLSQVDAAYGGKQGIDFNHFKNQVGVFKNPVAIFVQVELLKTLPQEQWVNGFAEVVKHALLAGGKNWKQIKGTEDLAAVNWRKAVHDSSAIKLEIVARDPLEMDLRKILNFGHTIGHAIETHLLNRGEPVLHGYCVAAGMIGELFLSQQLCGFPAKKMQEAIGLIRRHFPDVQIHADFDAELVGLMKQDKKNKAGRIQFALLQDIGEPVIGVETDEQFIVQALDYIRRLSAK